MTTKALSRLDAALRATMAKPTPVPNGLKPGEALAMGANGAKFRLGGCVPDWFTIPQAAKALGVVASTIDKAIRRGALAAVPMVGVYPWKRRYAFRAIPREELERFADTNTAYRVAYDQRTAEPAGFLTLGAVLVGQDAKAWKNGEVIERPPAFYPIDTIHARPQDVVITLDDWARRARVLVLRKEIWHPFTPRADAREPDAPPKRIGRPITNPGKLARLNKARPPILGA